MGKYDQLTRALMLMGLQALLSNGKPNNPNGNRPTKENPKPPSLEEKLNYSRVPRKAFEVYDMKGETPITCTEEAISIANVYLEQNGIDATKKDDTTRWDIFWAREMAAAQMAIGDRGVQYRSFLPGRYMMYELLADSIAFLLDKNDKKLANREILELGGGSGIGLILLAQQGASVTNLDNSIMALEFSRYLAKHHGVERMLNSVKEDFYDTNFADNRFDVVYNAGVFEHLNDAQAKKLLCEMARVTKLGGYVVIAIPNERSPFYKRLQEREGNIYDQFKKTFVRLPWEDRRRTFDFRKLMEGSSLELIGEDGLLIPPSEEVTPGDIQRSDIPIFDKYLSPDPPASLGSILSNWRGFHGSTDPNFRKTYGWSIYAVGQKKAA